MPAVITPFTDRRELDFVGLKVNIEFYINSGVSGLVINGSTGEAAALTREEKMQTVKAAVQHSNGHVKVVAGTGAPTTGPAITYARDAQEAGADAVLVLTPSTVIPSKEGLYTYYKEIAQAIEIPVLAYNLPQHTNVNITVDTLTRLADDGLVAGIKESSGNMSLMAQMISELGNKISVLTGADDLTLQSFVTGCSGAILALANIAPKPLVDLYEAVQRKDLAKAKDIYFKLLPVAQLIGSPENFPAPVKEAVKALGRPAGPCRSPVLPVSPEESRKITHALDTAGLIQKVTAR